MFSVDAPPPSENTVQTAEPDAEVVVAPTDVAESESAERVRDASGKFAKAEGETVVAEGAAVPEPEKTVEDEPLPANVKKRIAKEVEKQAAIDREIAQAVSKTKEKQAELAKLQAADTDKSGSEPVKHTASAPEGKPVRPKAPAAFGKSDLTWEQHQDALTKHDEALEAYESNLSDWLLKESKRTAEEEWQLRDRQSKFNQTIAEAKKVHGEGFDAMRQRVVDNTPDGLQIEIGMIEDWPSMVDHLANADHSAEMEKLVALYEANPSAAVRELGRIEDRLKKTVSTETIVSPKTKDKPLPAPPLRSGGSATAAPKIDLDAAPMGVFKKEIRAMLDRKT